MYSFNFPVMLQSGTTKLLKDSEAIKSNLNLLFHSESGELFGDPYFGGLIKQALFEQTTGIVADLLIDAIYTAVVTFIPQIYLTRKDISIQLEKTGLRATIKYVFLENNTADMYSILLTNDATR